MEASVIWVCVCVCVCFPENVDARKNVASVSFISNNGLLHGSLLAYYMRCWPPRCARCLPRRFVANNVLTMCCLIRKHSCYCCNHYCCCDFCCWFYCCCLYYSTAWKFSLAVITTTTTTSCWHGKCVSAVGSHFHFCAGAQLLATTRVANIHM